MVLSSWRSTGSSIAFSLWFTGATQQPLIRRNNLSPATPQRRPPRAAHTRPRGRRGKPRPTSQDSDHTTVRTCLGRCCSTPRSLGGSWTTYLVKTRVLILVHRADACRLQVSPATCLLCRITDWILRLASCPFHRVRCQVPATVPAARRWTLPFLDHNTPQVLLVGRCGMACPSSLHLGIRSWLPGACRTHPSTHHLTAVNDATFGLYV